MRTGLFRRLLALLVLTLAPATALAQGRVYLGVDASAATVTALGAVHGFPLAIWFQNVPGGIGPMAGITPNLPSWTTITRPSNPVVGTMGWNTTEGEPDIWTGSAWTQFCILSLCSGGGGGGSYNPAAVAITGGSINGTTLGATTPSTGVFTTLQANTSLKFQSGAFLNLPTWPNSARPGSPVAGTFGWDTTLSAPEVYTGSGWTQIPVAGGALQVSSGGTGQSTLTAHGLLIGEGASAIASMTAGTAGQCIISGGSSSDPAWGSCGSGGGAGTISPGTGISITGTASAPVINMITPVSVSLGGTGLATLTTHGVLLGEGANSVGITSPGTAGQCLISGGTNADPSWGVCSSGTGSGGGSGSGSGLGFINGYLVQNAAIISAAGTTQGTATLLAAQIAVVTTVSSGTGVELPAGVAEGTIEQVWNRGANTLLVYPNSSQTIESNSTNIPVQVPVGSRAEYVFNGTSGWYAN